MMGSKTLLVIFSASPATGEGVTHKAEVRESSVEAPATPFSGPDAIICRICASQRAAETIVRGGTAVSKGTFHLRWEGRGGQQLCGGRRGWPERPFSGVSFPVDYSLFVRLR